LGAIFQVVFFAKRYRRTRKVTLPEIIHARFGRAAEQFYSLAKIPSALLISGIWLWSMGIFTASAFSLDIHVVIIVVGVVVTTMASAGGSWAVMASDFVQSLIVVSIVILLSSLVIMDFGGIHGFVESLGTHSATKDYSFLKEAGEFSGNKFTLFWAMAQVGFTVMMFCSIEGSVRFLAVKDDSTAVKSALLVLVLMLLFPLILFVPAWGAAMQLGDQVAAAPGVNPAEAAYALAAKNWLPPQLLGIMGVAMLAATMSSMDTGINRTSGIVVRNILPFVLSLLGKEEMKPRTELRAGRICSIVFGATAISLAIYYNNRGSLGVFDTLLNIAALLGVPLAVPMLLGLLIRRAPGWAVFSSYGLGVSVGVFSLLAPHLGLEPWNFQMRAFGATIGGTVGFSVAILFWKRTPENERERILGFFKMLATPVDFEREVGEGNDAAQAKIIGAFGLALAACMIPLIFISDDLTSFLSILFVILFVGGVCGLLFAVGVKKSRNESSHKIQ